MELIYIWVERFTRFEKQGFNFSARWHLDFSRERNYLSIEEETNHHTSFFDEHISNITGIIGKNGSGKSSLLALLRPSNHEHYLSADYGYSIVVFFSKNDNAFYIMHTPCSFCENLEVIAKNFNKLPYNIVNKRSKDKDFENIFKSTLKHKTIYYNFQFEERRTIFGGELVDLSTRDIIKTLEHIIASDRQLRLLTDEYYLLDIQQKIALFQNFKEFHSETADFIPNAISVSYNIDFYCSMTLDTFRKGTLQNTSREFNKTEEEETEMYELVKGLVLTNSSIFETHTGWLRHSFFVNLLINTLYNGLYKDWAKTKIYCNTIYQKLTDKNFDFTTLCKYMSHWRNNKLGMECKEYDGGKLSQFIQLEKEINPNSFSYNDNPLFEKRLLNVFPIFNIPLGENKDKIFFKYIKDTFETLPFSFKWTSSDYSYDKHLLSYGEDALLTLFSRIYSIKEELEGRDNILICLDEPELGLHPEWQRSLLHKLVKFLPKILCFDKKGNPNGKKLQIVLTTHSPFIASDLPKNNIIFLEKEDKSFCVVDGVHQKETFGANIHTLLTDGFFMKGGLMGEFAKNKIDKLIAFLNTGIANNVIKNLDDASNMVNIIGEPILRRQLQKMLDSKRLEKIDSVDIIQDEISVLKSRLETLENKLKK
jgi:predicted ATPase